MKRVYGTWNSAYALERDHGIRKLTDFPFDHTAMKVPETEEMKALSAQIERLQAQYAELRETEQLKFWRGLLYIAKRGEM